MPVILPSGAQDRWMNGESKYLKILLSPFPAVEMTSHPVSYDVNHTKIDDAHLIRPLEPNLGVTARLF